MIHDISIFVVVEVEQLWCPVSKASTLQVTDCLAFRVKKDFTALLIGWIKAYRVPMALTKTRQVSSLACSAQLERRVCPWIRLLSRVVMARTLYPVTCYVKPAHPDTGTYCQVSTERAQHSYITALRVGTCELPNPF